VLANIRPKNILNTTKKILIIQTSFLGDVILALPMVQALKKFIPESEIDFICIPVTANVLENHPAINKIIQYDKKGDGKPGKLNNIIQQVRKEHYDIVLCPHRSFRSALITYFSKAAIKIGFDINSLSFLLTRKVPYVKQKHEIQRNLDLLRAIDGFYITNSNKTLKAELYPSEIDVKLTESLRSQAGAGKLITIAPCSRWFTKQLTVSKTTEIIKALHDKGHTVLMLGGPDDFSYCSELSNIVNNSEKLINMCGNLTPLQSYLIIKKSDVLITVDSAAQHLGGASDTPIVLIYGSTNKSFGFYPLSSRYTIVENTELTCRPCTDHGREKCPLGHFKCIGDLSVNKIIEETEKLMVKE
jgi:heptosyltransferase-2